MIGLEYTNNTTHGSTYFKDLGDELCAYLSTLDHPMLVTHAFSGMLALTQPLPQNLKGLVLMNAAADNAFITELPQRIQTIPHDAATVAAEFWLNPTDDSYKTYSLNLLPYSVTETALEIARSVLAQCTFRHEPYLHYVTSFLPNFQMAHIPACPTLVVTTDKDIICPAQFIKPLLILPRHNIQQVVIQDAAHIPWIDQPIATANMIQSWHETICRSFTRITQP